MSVPSSNELGLMRRLVLFFATTLTLLPLLFFLLRFALVLQSPESLADRSGCETGLLVSGVVEARCRFLFEGDICVVLRDYEVMLICGATN